MLKNQDQTPLKKVGHVTTKDRRISAYESLGQLIDWYSSAIDDAKILGDIDQVRADILSIIKRQKKTTKQLEMELAQALTNSARDQTLVLLSEKFRSLVRKTHTELLDIELIPGAGGRRRNGIVWKVAKLEYEKWLVTKGSRPSSSKLSKLVEIAMTKRNGHGRENGNLYLSPRNAAIIMNSLIDPRKINSARTS